MFENGMDRCTCPRTKCKLHGKCKECVVKHGTKNKLPRCKRGKIIRHITGTANENAVIKFIIKTLIAIGLILTGCFVITVIYDCNMYFKPIGGWQYYSSPLYWYILIRSFEFLLPAIISISAGYIIKSKFRK